MVSNSRFDVFVDGAHDRSVPGLSKAASKLAPLLSLPAEQVTKLLEGRFRVGMAVDEQTAQNMARSLTALGARVVISPAEATKSPGTAPRAQASPRQAPVAAAAPRAPAAAKSSPMSSYDDDGGISIGDLLNPQAAPALETAPTQSAAEPAHAPNQFDFNGGLDLGESALSVEDLPPPPAAPAKRAAVSPSKAAPAPAASPAQARPGQAPMAAPPQARGPQPPQASEDPFAPPSEEEEAKLDLAIDSSPAAPPMVRAAPQPAATSTGEVTRERKAYVPERPAISAKAVLFAVLSLAIGALPGHFYASSTDKGQVLRLQTEMQDLTVNAWKQETRNRKPEAVRQEIEQVRTRATWLMMLIWATTTALLAAAAFMFLL